MKKLILILAGLFLLNQGFSGIYITKSNPDPNTGKYEKVTEKHVGYIWVDHHLTCSNPGPTDCSFTVDPATPAGGANSLVDVIESHIEAGEVSGSIDFGSGVIGSWSSNGDGSSTITIEW